MPDDIDRAQEREEEMRSDALAEYRRRAHGDPAVPSAWQCAVCGEYLPEWAPAPHPRRADLRRVPG